MLHSDPHRLELKAEQLACQDKYGNTLLMRMLTLYVFDEIKIHPVSLLIDCLHREVPPVVILELLAKRNVSGGNCLHAAFGLFHADMQSEFFFLLEELLHRTRDQKRQMINAVYGLMMQQAGYLTNRNIVEKPVDRIASDNKLAIEGYVKLVLKMTRNGLHPSRTLELLDKKNQPLLPEFWRLALLQTEKQILKLISTGSIGMKSLQRFVNKKQMLLRYVLALEDKDEERQWLEKIVDRQQPLGRLFLLRAPFEISGQRLVKAAAAALRALAQSCESLHLSSPNGLSIVHRL